MRTRHLWHRGTRLSHEKQALLKPESSSSLASSLSADKEDKIESSMSLVLTLQHKSKSLTSSLWRTSPSCPWDGPCRVITRRSPSPRCPCSCPQWMSTKVHLAARLIWKTTRVDVLHNKTFVVHIFSAQIHYFTRLTIEEQTFWKLYQWNQPSLG